MLLIEKIEKYKIPILIIALNALVYLIIFLIRIEFGPYATIESPILRNMFVSLFFVASLLSLYFWGFKRIKEFSPRLIVIGYLIFVFILIITPLLASMDMYMYAMRGRIVSVYEGNPYLKSAADFSGDSFFKYICMTWAKLTQNYGALWTIFSSSITRLAPDSIDLTYLFYKMFAFIGNSIVLILLYLITKLKSFDKLKTKKILFLYAWSPVFLIEFVNNAHNDVWMIVFGMLGLYFYYKQKNILIIPCLILSGLVKYAYWILVPIFLIFFLREKRLNVKKLFYSFLISLILLIAICLPFFNSFEALKGLVWQVGMNIKANHLFSPFLLGVLSLGNLIGFPSISLFVSGILLTGRLLFSFAYLVNLFLKQNIIKAIAISLTLFALLVPSTILPWYVTWFLPFLILGLYRKNIAFWTCAVMVAYPLVYSLGTSILVLAMIFWIYFVFVWIKKQQLFFLIN